MRGRMHIASPSRGPAEAGSSVLVAAGCGVIAAGRCWVRGRRRWSLLVAGWCVQVMLLCSVLCVLPLCFCTSISGRVGSGQPNTYRAKNQKKPAIQPWLPWLWQPPWRRHTQPATPPLFGGIFSNFCHAFPPWPLFDNTGYY